MIAHRWNVRRSFKAWLIICLSAAVCPALRADVAQWDFEGDLSSTTGHAAMFELAAAPAPIPEVSFEKPLIAGEEALAAHFTRGTFFRVMPGVGPNGGGIYVNRYTLILDVMFPDRSPSGGWAALLQTNENNANDGDWFVNPDGGVGISGNYGGSVPAGEWHRLALVVDLVAGTYTSFVDGVQVQQNTAQVLDGRFSLYSVNDGALDGFSLFADENGDNAEGFVNSVQFRDAALSPADIAALGGPSAEGIPIPADPRECSLRNFSAQYDAAANRVTGSWVSLPGDQGFRVFQGARQVGVDLGAAATSFVDASPPAGGRGIVYTLAPLIGGAVERRCDAAPIDTFGCLDALECCPDQSARSVTLRWQAPTNITVTAYSVRRDGVEVGTPEPASTSFTDIGVPAPGTYEYEVSFSAGILSGLCPATCRTTVTGIAISPSARCGGIVNSYHFDGDLSSATGGRDLVPLVGPPLQQGVDPPGFSFEAAVIDGAEARVLRYSRGTHFRLFTGMGPNGGGIYTNQFTLLMDVLFEPGAIDVSGWAALYQTNEANANDGDWFVRSTDRGVGISGNYGGVVEDGEWHRLALVVDLVAGTFTSYVNGQLVQQNTGEPLDGRFSLYTLNDGDFEGFSIFADDSGDNSAGLVNSVQVRDVALPPGEVARFGGPRASGIPVAPPCPGGLLCRVDPSARRVTLSWDRGADLPGDGFTLRRDGVVVASLPLTADTYTDGVLAPGVYLYDLSLNERESGCVNLPLACKAEVLADWIFYEDFDSYGDDGALAGAGWEVRDESQPVEDAAWTVENPAGRANPPSFNGRPTNGRFAISDSAFGGEPDRTNAAGSGMSHDLWSPSFSTLGQSAVWLHADVAAQLNNNGDAVFAIDVSTDGGATWRSVFERVSPGRTLDPVPEVNLNADGAFGRLHLDLSAHAANRPSVRLRFRHFEPTWDWWVAVDNVVVDRRPGAGGPVNVLALEDFAAGIPASWRVVSGPESDGSDPWSPDDPCVLSLETAGGVFPDAFDGRGLHHLESPFALIDPACSAARADEFLITPALDLTGMGRVFLHFRSAVIASTRARAEVLLSHDGGQSFLPAPVFSYNLGALVAPDEEPFYGEHVIEVPAAAGRANVSLAFHYQSLTSTSPPGTWWAVDDVAVTAERTGGRVFHRADSDGNLRLELTDAVRILNYLFLGTGVLSCLKAADADDNGRLELTDAVRILNFLFLGTGLIPAPGPTDSPCGPDPTPDELTCDAYPGC